MWHHEDNKTLSIVQNPLLALHYHKNQKSLIENIEQTTFSRAIAIEIRELQLLHDIAS
jgi:hypothetical protein